MFFKGFKIIFTISIFTISLTASACIEEGKSVGVYPGAPDCCKGLELKPPAPGIYGGAGTCIKKNDCVEEGKSVGVYPGAPDCCKGLELKPPAPGIYGGAGTCIKKNDCVEEGKSVGVYPGAPDCCEGFELQQPNPGVYGSAGRCVESRHPSASNVNDSRIQDKDSLPANSMSPSKSSSAIER